VKALTWRDYRWMWLSAALGLTAGAIFLVPYLVLYLPACLIAKGFNWLADRIYAVHAACWNRDLARKRGYAREPGAARPEGRLP
jgi:hypothetical protein